jgi:hypothetical protein
MKKGYWLLFLWTVGFLLNFIIPPFQNPDEPQHFAAVMIYARGEENRPAVEKEVIRLMDKYNWWKHLGMGKPVELPEALSDIPFLVSGYPVKDFRVMLRNIVLYHFLLGKGLGFFCRGNMEEAYFLCRFVSFVFILGALVLVWKSLKKIEGKGREGFLFILFLPQFLQAAVSVNSDALAILLGSLFFYAAVSLIRGDAKISHFFFLFTAAGIGFFSDRSVFLLIPMTVIIPFFIIKKEIYKESIVYILAILIVVLMLTSILVNIFPLQFENSITLFGSNLESLGEALPRLFAFDAFGLRFFAASMDSFFLRFGWAVFGPGAGFYIFWRIMVIFSIAGVVVFLGMRAVTFFKRGPFWVRRVKTGLGIKPAKKHLWKLEGRSASISPRSPLKRSRTEPAKAVPAASEEKFLMKLVVFSLLAVFFQLAAAWTYYGSHEILAQGRHFFPLIIPVAFLFVVGIKCFFDLFHAQAGRIALTAFVVLEFFFLNTIIWARMFPFFHMIIKSPHPGI